MLEKKIQIKILEKVLDKLINSRHIEKLGLCTLINRELKKRIRFGRLLYTVKYRKLYTFVYPS